MGQLRDRMEQDLILKGFQPATRRNYLLYGRRLAAFIGAALKSWGRPTSAVSSCISFRWTTFLIPPGPLPISQTKPAPPPDRGKTAPRL